MKRQIGETYYTIREKFFVRPAFRMRKVLGTPIHPIHILGFARGGSTIMAELAARGGSWVEVDVAVPATVLGPGLPWVASARVLC